MSFDSVDEDFPADTEVVVFFKLCKVAAREVISPKVLVLPPSCWIANSDAIDE